MYTVGRESVLAGGACRLVPGNSTSEVIRDVKVSVIVLTSVVKNVSLLVKTTDSVKELGNLSVTTGVGIVDEGMSVMRVVAVWLCG
jgi:hypothetical protein